MTTEDDTRDVAIKIMEHLIERFGWDKTDQREEEWYDFELQDSIQEIITIGNSTCSDCDQYPYSDTDNMCPVCGREAKCQC